MYSEFRISAPFSPITFEADKPRLLRPHFDDRGALWATHIKAVRLGIFCEVFTDVLFVESHATASVLGMEEADGRPRGIDPAIADDQQFFIRFLREQTQIDADALGLMTTVLLHHEYACEAAATAAYVTQRDALLHLGVGYVSDQGAYKCLGIEHQPDVGAAFSSVG